MLRLRKFEGLIVLLICLATNTYGGNFSFTHASTGAIQLQVCIGSTLSLDSFLKITTTGVADLYTWSIDSTSGGTITGLPASLPFSVGQNTGGPTVSFTAASGTYNFTIKVTDTLNGSITRSFHVSVNPGPAILTKSSTICSGTKDSIYASDSSILTWTVSPNNLGATAGNGLSRINQLLTNTTNTKDSVIYTVSSPGNCQGQQTNVTIIVSPAPKLIINKLSICSGASVNINIDSLTTTNSSKKFKWSIDTTGTGIKGATSQSTFIATKYILDILTNTSNSVSKQLAYKIITQTAEGCTSNEDTIMVNVNPVPIVTSNLKDSVCSGNPYNKYTITSSVSGINGTTKFAWSRPGFGTSGSKDPKSDTTSKIIDQLYTDSTSFVSIQYTLTLTTTAGCKNDTTRLNVMVSPAPELPQIAVPDNGTSCSNLLNQNLSVNNPKNTLEYKWSSVGGNVLICQNGGPNAIVNFPEPNTDYQIVLKSNYRGFGCWNNGDTTTVHTNADDGNNPSVTYFNNSLVCFYNNANDYTWGVDNKLTLDSMHLKGINNQETFYFTQAPVDPNISQPEAWLDTSKYYYWVIVSTENGCIKKAYYNAPLMSTGIKNVTPEYLASSITVYPNPAGNSITVSLEDNAHGNYTIDVLDFTGRILSTTSMRSKKQLIAVNNLAQGYYLISCKRDGVVIAAAKFIKS